MDNQEILAPFVADDGFLRHIDRPKRVQRMDGIDTITAEVFKLRGNEQFLSLTYQDGSLKTEVGLDAYREAKRLPHGDLVGLCKLTLHDLTESLSPPRPPRSDPVREDHVYGHLHCIIDPPTDDEHMEQMAKLATRNGLLRPFERRKR